MKYAKIVVKSNYEKKGDLVLRSYVRALTKIGETRLLDGQGNAFIYGVIDDFGRFHELFTNEIIDFDDYIIINIEELIELDYISDSRKALLKKIMESVLFDKKVDLNFEISSMLELAEDRAVEFKAYNDDLSKINPYRRISERENQDLYNAYNSFSYKIKTIKTYKRLSKEIQNNDEYEVKEYQPRPKQEVDYEYLVFEVPKIFKK